MPQLERQDLSPAVPRPAWRGASAVFAQAVLVSRWCAGGEDTRPGSAALDHLRTDLTILLTGCEHRLGWAAFLRSAKALAVTLWPGTGRRPSEIAVRPEAGSTLDLADTWATFGDAHNATVLAAAGLLLDLAPPTVLAGLRSGRYDDWVAPTLCAAGGVPYRRRTAAVRMLADTVARSP